MLGIPLYLWPPIFGVVIWLTVCFQVSLGLRWIKLGRKHFTIHKWIGISIAIAGPLHGLMATSVFLGWPFKIL